MITDRPAGPPEAARGPAHTHGVEGHTDVLIAVGATFWARTGPDTATNGGDPCRTHGGGDLTQLLDPSTVPS